ncbi:Enoyl-CoA hydratase/isomerase family [Musa troglodytarum]|uniref:3-hydroxyisobutyryl-CoA hydrolase n=1 Tax=Musa troglodytarum TaxID=320322 RepID=A0A9E7K1A1_9LILI|nr:Enoyl-CoA hydratase/isomerase family [Musa troglodytarum]
MHSHSTYDYLMTLDMIDKCFSKETVEDIVSALLFMMVHVADHGVDLLLLDARIQIREGRLQGVDRCLTKEFRLCCHILRLEASKDFLEVPHSKQAPDVLPSLSSKTLDSSAAGF